MTGWRMDMDKWELPPATELSRIWRGKVRQLVKKRVNKLITEEGDWKKIVNRRTLEIISSADLEEIDREIIGTGRRYDFSARISQKESPEKYKS
jgi:hypothetical protein